MYLPIEMAVHTTTFDIPSDGSKRTATKFCDIDTPPKRFIKGCWWLSATYHCPLPQMDFLDPPLIPVVEPVEKPNINREWVH